MTTVGHTISQERGRRFHRPSGAAVARVSVVVLILVLVVSAVAASYIYLSTRPQEGVCDNLLSEQIGATATHQCLQPLSITESSLNSSEFYVPVLVLKPGGTGTMNILYHISATVMGHRGPLPTITSADVPLTLSVTVTSEGGSQVRFSNGVLVFNISGWLLYKYTVTAPANSTGYYAIEPPYYYGTYPALAVGGSPKDLNMSALSMWGFTGVMQSAEFTVPSTIVGTSGFNIVNATVPGISYCPNAACVLISRSAY